MTLATILHLLLVAFLVVVFPIWDRREARRLKTSHDPEVRLRSYQMTIAWQIAASALLLATLPARALFTAPATPRELGIDVGPAQVIPVLAALLVGAALPVLLARRKNGAAPEIPSQLGAIDFFLPRGRRERVWFAAMCVTVGVCEEIIFRGFLVRFLAAGPPVALGIAGGVAVAALIFGIDHGYQGITGILATGVLALVFTALFFITGSLWVPMIVHALLDLRVLLLVPPGWNSPRAGLPPEPAGAGDQG
ncbi:MAG TPA: CPBP family intramembrane glutamic endopeptidase [Longimicrobium sp.]|nr:CPBP family intramembrane glutamic endopeptidase [Longimicrobium sp.]